MTIETTHAFAPHEAVRALEGRWTVRGMEETYTEICELFPGGHHLVCYATSLKGENVGRHMSIITWSAEEGCYLYSGIGSSGSVRVTMTPFEEGFQFLEEYSTDGKTWIVDADFDYIRLEGEA